MSLSISKQAAVDLMGTFPQNGGNSDMPPLSEAMFPSRTPRLAFSVRETADALGISEKTVRRLVFRRLLNPSRALRHLLISKKEVERFLADTSV